MTSLKDTLLITVIGIFLFGAIFSFIISNVPEEETGLNNTFTDTFAGLQEKQANLNNTLTDAKNGLKDVVEPKGAVNVVFGGLSGLLAVIRLFIGTIDLALSGLGSFIGIVNIPASISVTVSLLIFISLIFALIKLFTQRSNDP